MESTGLEKVKESAISRNREWIMTWHQETWVWLTVSRAYVDLKRQGHPLSSSTLSSKDIPRMWKRDLHQHPTGIYFLLNRLRATRNEMVLLNEIIHCLVHGLNLRHYDYKLNALNNKPRIYFKSDQLRLLLIRTSPSPSQCCWNTCLSVSTTIRW